MKRGPHAIWERDREGREPSGMKVARVRRRKTLADLAGETGYSIAQVHRLEVGGHGSADLRRRVGQVLDIAIPPARGNFWPETQLVLFGGSSS